MAYKLSFTFAFPAGECHFPPQMGLVYGTSKTHPSIIVGDLPYLIGFYLPAHISKYRNSYRLDAELWSAGDDWCYREFFTVLPNSKHNLLHVTDWMKEAPKGVPRLNGKPILALEVIS